MTNSAARVGMRRRIVRTCYAGGLGLALLGIALTHTAAAADASATPYLEQLTSTELRERIAAGDTTVLVPIGGTEQNGAHMVLGKHNARAHLLAGTIAQRLGHTIVAPVMAYVPEGSIEPPAAHMRFSGTLSIPEATFEAVLDATARSLRRHGFRTIVLLGDHGGYQASLERVAAKLGREWKAGVPAVRVLALTEYYRVTQTAYVGALKARGVSTEEIGTHAGLADTSLALALDPALVRQNLLAQPAAAGVQGDPRRSSAELGRLGVERIVEASVAAIRSRSAAP